MCSYRINCLLRDLRSEGLIGSSATSKETDSAWKASVEIVGEVGYATAVSHDVDSAILSALSLPDRPEWELYLGEEYQDLFVEDIL